MVVIKSVALLAFSRDISAAPTLDALVHANSLERRAVATCAENRLFTDDFERYKVISMNQGAGINEYEGLYYEAWAAATKSIVTGAVGGLVPRSENNVAVASMTSALRQSGQLTFNAYGNIVAPIGKSFDIHEFWFGCTLNLRNSQLPSTALGCDIAIIGYKNEGTLILEHALFVPQPNTLKSNMQKVVLGEEFKELRNFTLGISSSTGLTSQTVLVIDDVIHCNSD